METDQIDRPREFKKLLLASFISQSGSHFMTLAIAFTVYALSGGSMVKAALVMVFSYLPVIFLTKLAGSLIDRKLSVRMLLVFEASAAIVSVICGALVYFDQFIVLLPLLCARCLLTFATRAALSRWIKLISSLGKQGVRLKIFLLGFFLATTVAGILAILTLGIDLRPAIVNVVIIDVVTYLISMLVILSLKSLPETPVEIQKVEISGSQEAFSDTLGQILQQPVLKKTFLRVVLSQALFQGAYLALIAVIADHFDLGLKAGAFFQISASIGLIIAFVVLWIFPLCMREKKDA
ncbi:MAG TPA: hypothetical protein VGO47_11265, partial [Chlamydiales bacterium]|nr:hypothetical protein [Chlamydiales bacterium]